MFQLGKLFFFLVKNICHINFIVRGFEYGKDYFASPS